MFPSKSLRIAALAAIISSFCMPAYAEFTAKELLTQSEVNRSSYIRISLMMANLIARENDPVQAKCLGDWYDKDRNGTERFIYDVMQKNSQHHPLSIIFAIAEKKCGSFKYTDR